VPWIFTNQEVEAALPMATLIDALEEAYRAQAEGRAISRPRTDTYLARPENRFYVLKSMDGIDGASGVAAIRLNSDLIQWREAQGKTRKDKVPTAPNGRYNGLVLLFSVDTGELLAIFPDGVLQKLRVQATNALSAKFLARKDSRVFGLIGTGWQASSAIEAVAAVRPLTKVLVYSPNPEHRRSFAERESLRLGLEVIPVDRPEEAVRQADIVGTATNALTRVVEPEWIQPGTHLFCVKYIELGDAVRSLAHAVVVNHKKATPTNYIPGLGRFDVHDPIDLLKLGTSKDVLQEPEDQWAATIPDLSDLVAHSELHRKSDEAITMFVNNIGTGLQFAAGGAALLREARARGMGLEVPIDWFTQDVHP
jgi:alanine dehydrogenase